jgi:hypothetical protein
MSITHVVDNRDEELLGKNYWFSPEDKNCGITLFFETCKIHFTSDQLDSILKEWTEKQGEVKEKLAVHMLSHSAQPEGDGN